MTKRIAILFFGLTRCLNKTIKAFKENLFTPLIDNSFEYDIFIHTYKIYGPYYNKWAGEYTDNYENEDIESLLHPAHFIYDNQDDIINSINFEEYYTNVGNWSGDFQVDLVKYLIKNMCLALYSKKRITNYFEQYKNNYDYGIIIRPELLLTNKIDVDFFNELTENNIIIPMCDSHSGINDRLCIGKIDTILYYGTLFDHLKTYSENKSICSEIYLNDKLHEKNIYILKKNIDYQTLRM